MVKNKVSVLCHSIRKFSITVWTPNLQNEDLMETTSCMKELNSE